MTTDFNTRIAERIAQSELFKQYPDNQEAIIGLVKAYIELQKAYNGIAPTIPYSEIAVKTAKDPKLIPLDEDRYPTGNAYKGLMQAIKTFIDEIETGCKTRMENGCTLERPEWGTEPIPCKHRLGLEVANRIALNILVETGEIEPRKSVAR